MVLVAVLEAVGKEMGEVFLPFQQAVDLSNTVTGIHDPPSQMFRPNCHCSVFIRDRGGGVGNAPAQNGDPFP